MHFLVPVQFGELQRGVQINAFILKFQLVDHRTLDQILVNSVEILELVEPMGQVLGHFGNQNGLYLGVDVLHIEEQVGKALKTELIYDVLYLLYLLIEVFEIAVLDIADQQLYLVGFLDQDLDRVFENVYLN